MREIRMSGSEGRGRKAPYPIGWIVPLSRRILLHWRSESNIAIIRCLGRSVYDTGWHDGCAGEYWSRS